MVVSLVTSCIGKPSVEAEVKVSNSAPSTVSQCWTDSKETCPHVVCWERSGIAVRSQCCPSQGVTVWEGQTIYWSEMQAAGAEWLRLEGISGDCLLRAISTRGDCSRTISHWVWNILMEVEIPPLLWEICAVTPWNKEGGLCLEGVPCIPVCAQMTP